jgi:predicted phosphodiesterase
MQIALFSDIHANLPALEACLKNIEDQKPDATYCLGDLAGYNIWTNEVINEIRKRGIPTLQETTILVLEERAMIAVALIKQMKKRQWVKFLFLLPIQ